MEIYCNNQVHGTRDTDPTSDLAAAKTFKELTEAGFSTIPGPLTGDRWAELVDAYDRVMSQASGPDFRAGSTTNRMWDLLSFSRIFDEVFLHKPLLEACSQVMDEPFKLSSFLGRTLRAGTRAQELHADLPRTSPDVPLLGFHPHDRSFS